MVALKTNAEIDAMAAAGRLSPSTRSPAKPPLTGPAS